MAASYRGANSEDVEQAVAVPIEQQMTGLDGLLYISSLSSSAGTYSLSLTFEVGTDIDLAVVKVQNKVALAEPFLPEDVRRVGVNAKKVSSGFLMAIALTSPEGRYDDLFLANYATINIIDRLGSIQGVGEARLGSARDYGMRLWVNPEKMAKLGLTASDLAGAITSQNRQNPAGAVGRPPISSGVDLTYPVIATGRLTEASEFANIIVRADLARSIVRIKDVGRAELGAADYSSYSRLNGEPAAVIVVSLAPGANALATAGAVQRSLEEARQSFPAGIEYRIPFNTTDFVRISIEEVIQTFLEALGLVILVVFVFLQNWRATLIPLLTVPVSIIGTFALFPLLGFSINTISLFGMVLAIGIVVDDAIVVVEAVQHNIDEEGLSPREATVKAMGEVAGPVVAIAFILAAVFIPVAFLGGITGQIYRQFALTIAVSVILSAISALTLSPALSAILLRPAKHGGRGPLARFYALFNRGFAWTTDKYLGRVKFLIRRAAFALVPLLLLYLGTYGLFRVVPTGFLPDEDQGYFFVAARLPDGASLERTQAVMPADRADRRRDARDQELHHAWRLRLHQPDEQHQRRVADRHAQAVGRAPDAGAAARRDPWPRPEAVIRDRERARFRVRAAADPRAGHLGRVRVLHPGPRRPRPRRAVGGGRGDGRRDEESAGDHRSFERLPRERAAVHGQARPRQGADRGRPGACRL